MIAQSRGIVLHHIKYGENSNIVYIYTDRFGRQAYLVNGSRSKKDKSQNTMLQPFSLLDFIAYHSHKRELQRIKEMSPIVLLHGLTTDIVKKSIALFLAEVLYKTVREHEPNPPLFEFIFNSIQILDLSQVQSADFHLLFLSQLTRYLGFAPHTNYTLTNNVFDLKAGAFQANHPHHTHLIDKDYSRMWYNLVLQSGYPISTDDKLNLSKEQRALLLEKLIEYYHLHIEGMGLINSYNVLKQLFA